LIWPILRDVSAVADDESAPNPVFEQLQIQLTASYAVWRLINGTRK
jgi:hypothetical protein